MKYNWNTMKLLIVYIWTRNFEYLSFIAYRNRSAWKGLFNTASYLPVMDTLQLIFLK